MKNVLHESITNIAYRIGEREASLVSTFFYSRAQREGKIVMNVLCSKICEHAKLAHREFHISFYALFLYERRKKRRILKGFHIFFTHKHTLNEHIFWPIHSSVSFFIPFPLVVLRFIAFVAQLPWFRILCCQQPCFVGIYQAYNQVKRFFVIQTHLNVLITNCEVCVCVCALLCASAKWRKTMYNIERLIAFVILYLLFFPLCQQLW